MTIMKLLWLSMINYTVFPPLNWVCWALSYISIGCFTSFINKKVRLSQYDMRGGIWIEYVRAFSTYVNQLLYAIINNYVWLSEYCEHEGIHHRIASFITLSVRRMCAWRHLPLYQKRHSLFVSVGPRKYLFFWHLKSLISPLTRKQWLPSFNYNDEFLDPAQINHIFLYTALLGKNLNEDLYAVSLNFCSTGGLSVSQWGYWYHGIKKLHTSDPIACLNLLMKIRKGNQDRSAIASMLSHMISTQWDFINWGSACLLQLRLSSRFKTWGYHITHKTRLIPQSIRVCKL